MELVATTKTLETWIAYIFGDLPPGYELQDDGKEYNGEGLYEKGNTLWVPRVLFRDQVNTGKVYPWIVFTHRPGSAQWIKQGVFPSKEFAIVSARHKLRVEKLVPRGTTYTPKMPDFERYLKIMAEELKAAKKPRQRAEVLAKIQKIDAAFSLLKETQQDIFDI